MVVDDDDDDDAHNISKQLSLSAIHITAK